MTQGSLETVGKIAVVELIMGELNHNMDAGIGLSALHASETRNQSSDMDLLMHERFIRRQIFTKVTVSDN